MASAGLLRSVHHEEGRAYGMIRIPAVRSKQIQTDVDFKELYFF